MNLDDLIDDMTSLIKEIDNEVPKEIASLMEANKNDNFRKEGYGEDGFEKWEDRPFEEELNYKKLDYTGKLKNSWKTKSKKQQARIYSDNPLSKLHQEGGATNGSPMIRKPPSSTRNLYAVVKTVRQRKMVGVGIRTLKGIDTILDKAIKKYLK